MLSTCSWAIDTVGCHRGQSAVTMEGKMPAQIGGEEQKIVECDPRWQLAQRAARSPALSRAAQLRAILLYIVQQAILRPEEPVHEFEIAYRVLGRRSDFNPLDDSIVRVQMAHLRKRLDLYFSKDGINESILITIGLGSYEPVFSNRTIPVHASQHAPEPENASGEQAVGVDVRKAAAIIPGVAHLDPDALAASPSRHWIHVRNILSATFILGLAAGCLALWVQNRALKQSLESTHRSLYAWQDTPTVLAFWSQFFNASQDTDVVMGDASFSLVQVLSKRSFSLNDYLSRSYISQLQAQNMSPDMHAAMTLIPSWNLGSKNGFYMARRILSLDPTGAKIHLYYARDYMAALIQKDNVILIGSPIGNPWVDLFEDRLNFVEKFDSNNPVSPVSISNRTPVSNEQEIYTPDGSTSYCAVAYLPNLDHNGNVLLFVGTDSETTQAAGDFLLSEGQLSSFQKMLHVSKFPYFEVLLKTSEVKGTPLSATVVTYRTYPNLH